MLYDHFSSKQALFLAILEATRDELIVRGTAIAKSQQNPEEKFRRGVEVSLEFVEQRPSAARVLLTIPRGDSLAAKLAREVQAGATAGISRLLVAYMPASQSWCLELAAEFLKEGLHAIGRWWLENPGPSREEIAEVVMRIVWVGFNHKVRSSSKLKRTADFGHRA